MADADQIITPVGEMWGLKREGNSFITALFPTFEDALRSGLELARRNKSHLFLVDAKGKRSKISTALKKTD